VRSAAIVDRPRSPFTTSWSPHATARSPFDSHAELVQVVLVAVQVRLVADRLVLIGVQDELIVV
jgi:hypothetical protein